MAWRPSKRKNSGQLKPSDFEAVSGTSTEQRRPWRFAQFKCEEALSPVCIRRGKVSSSDLIFHLRKVQIPLNRDCGDSVDTSSAPREARASIHSVVSSALRQQLTPVQLGPTQTFRLRGNEKGQAPSSFVRGALSNSNPRKHSHPSDGSI